MQSPESYESLSSGFCIQKIFIFFFYFFSIMLILRVANVFTSFYLFFFFSFKTRIFHYSRESGQELPAGRHVVQTPGYRKTVG